MKGYWPSAWPGEDGGPSRRQSAPGALIPDGGGLVAHSRHVLGGVMCVQREPGQLYFQGATFGPDSTAWVERIDPHTLDPRARRAELPAGPWWPGGILAHANGDLYVTQGRWCHRLSAELECLASVELPRTRAYNSLLALDNGHLVMKDMSSDDSAPSQLVVLDPESLATVLLHDLPEGSIARLSGDGDRVCVVGTRSLIALDVTDRIDEIGRVEYRTVEGQTFGWDAVLTGDGSAWFLDNGEGTEAFAGSFFGATSSSAPLHLVRANWPPNEEPVTMTEICGRPGGIVANPPIVRADERGIVAVGYDSGHGVMAAWRATGPPTRSGLLDPLWQRTQNHAAHSILYDSGELVTFDFDIERGMDQCVVLDIDSGREVSRVDTGSPIQSVVFPCPGWDHDVYALSLTTLTRVRVDRAQSSQSVSP